MLQLIADAYDLRAPVELPRLLANGFKEPPAEHLKLFVYVALPRVEFTVLGVLSIRFWGRELWGDVRGEPRIFRYEWILL